MNGQARKIELLPHEDCGCGIELPEYEPFSMLYYEETHFASPHYQSIRPKSEPPLSQKSIETIPTLDDTSKIPANNSKFEDSSIMIPPLRPNNFKSGVNELDDTSTLSEK